MVWFLFPDTNGLPLEEIAAIFGDEDEVAIYQRDLEIDLTTHTVREHDTDTKPGHLAHVETDPLPRDEK